MQATVPPSAASPSDFLRALWGDAKGIAELTKIDGKGVIGSFPFSYPDSLESFVFAAGKHNKSNNVYMGVCLRRETWPRKTGLFGPDGTEKVEKRGTEKNIASAHVVWCEADFEGEGHKGKVISREKVHEKLAAFPWKPSIVVKSGGGIQVYWILKEPAVGDDVWRVKEINKSLIDAIGADPQCVDLARILRVPGLLNRKYSPPRPVEISWWHPGFRYTLSDFESVLHPERVARAAVASVPGGTGATPVSGATPAAAAAPLPPAAKPRTAVATPTVELDASVAGDIGQMLGEIWIEGHRHSMALCVAGWLRRVGITLLDAKSIVQRASDLAKGDTDKRLRDVEDTYQRFDEGHEIKGATSLETMIAEEFPPVFRDRALKTIEAIRKKLPRPKRTRSKGVDPDFTIVQITKFDSRPARYEVKIHRGTQDHEVTVETPVLNNYHAFREAFFEATPNLFLAPIQQWRWEEMVAAAHLEVKPAPREASSTGAIEAALEDFLDSKKERPEVATLRTFAGYDEAGVFFTLSAFKGHMRDKGLKVSDREVTHFLRLQGWEDERRRMGDRAPRIWLKPSSNGNGHADHKKPDMFGEVDSGSTTRARGKEIS